MAHSCDVIPVMPNQNIYYKTCSLADLFLDEKVLVSRDARIHEIKLKEQLLMI